jgi:hypothetical protein
MITLRIVCDYPNGRPLAEWRLACVSITAPADEFNLTNDLTTFGDGAVLTIVLPGNMLTGTPIYSRMLAETAWVYDNWETFDKLFREIEEEYGD